MVWAARSHSFGREQYFSTEAMRMFLTFLVLYHRVVLCHNKVQSISSSQRQFPPKRQVETFLNDAIAGGSLEKATAVTLKGTSDPNTLSQSTPDITYHRRPKPSIRICTDDSDGQSWVRITGTEPCLVKL